VDTRYVVAGLRSSAAVFPIRAYWRSRTPSTVFFSCLQADEFVAEYSMRIPSRVPNFLTTHLVFLIAQPAAQFAVNISICSQRAASTGAPGLSRATSGCAAKSLPPAGLWQGVSGWRRPLRGAPHGLPVVRSHRYVSSRLVTHPG